MVKIGIIGLGGITRNVHIPEIKESKDGIITAICDADEKLLNDSPDEMNLCIGEIDVESHGMHTIRVLNKYRVSQEQMFIDMVNGKACQYLPTVTDGISCQKIPDSLLESSEKNCWISLK